MVIYVVKKGDSPWSIARKFGVDYNDIVSINGLKDRKHLVVGESLLIPVRPNIRKEEIEVNGFLIPTTFVKDKQVVNEVGKYLTYITPFSRHVNVDGSLSSLNDLVIRQEAAKNNVAVMLSVTNISGAGFDTELINKILNDKNAQERLINNIINTISENGMKGAVIDFERIGPENRQKYNEFLYNLVQRLHERNYLAASSLAPKTSQSQAGVWYEAHDYAFNGRIMDFVILMTYEWGWSGGPPRAVAPLDQVKKVIDYAVSVIPSNKIMMGIPNYGYDWTLPYVKGGKFAEAIGNKEAVERAEKFGANIAYDYVSQAPYYKYIANQRTHAVWFEDARSINAKFNLVKQYGLRGVSYWALGKEFPQNWALIDSDFKVKKIV
ncbi:MAG: glycosyl hydrolase family 18 protein [Clostridium sp.]|nr:glycosyl hydrolase family 18 protein [Clostridium sp.]